MKLLISFVSVLLLIFTTITVGNAATEVVTTVTKTTVIKPAHIYKPQKHYHHYYYCKPHKYKRHYKGSNRISSYYYPGYCVADASACGGVVCYPAQYYQCQTEYYYHSGRNTARVEVCN